MIGDGAPGGDVRRHPVGIVPGHAHIPATQRAGGEGHDQPFLNLITATQPIGVEMFGTTNYRKLKPDILQWFDAVLAPTGTDDNLHADGFKLIQQRNGFRVKVTAPAPGLVIEVVTIDDTININPPSEEDKAFPGFSA